MVEWNNKRIILSVPACCDTDSIAGVCGDLLQDTVGLDGTVVAGGWINVRVEHAYSMCLMPWRKRR